MTKKTTKNGGRSGTNPKKKNTMPVNTATTKKKATMPANTAKKKTPAEHVNSRARGESVGKVYRGKTKYIDPETKAERNYVVVVDDGKRVSVAKLKSIKIFDENGRNADRALVEINATRYGLEKRTGVDFQTFDQNRMSKKPLQLEDDDVFPEGKERFKLGSHDTHKVLVHTNKVPRSKKKKR